MLALRGHATVQRPRSLTGNVEKCGYERYDETSPSRDCRRLSRLHRTAHLPRNKYPYNKTEKSGLPFSHHSPSQPPRVHSRETLLNYEQRLNIEGFEQCLVACTRKYERTTDLVVPELAFRELHAQFTGFF